MHHLSVAIEAALLNLLDLLFYLNIYHNIYHNIQSLHSATAFHSHLNLDSPQLPRIQHQDA
jgi:hypothetical protein